MLTSPHATAQRDRLAPLLRATGLVPVMIAQLVGVAVVLLTARTDEAIAQSLRVAAVLIAMPCGAVLTDRAAVTLAPSPTTRRYRAVERAAIMLAPTLIAWSLALALVHRYAIPVPAWRLTGHLAVFALVSLATATCALRRDPSASAGAPGAATSFAFAATLVVGSRFWAWVPTVGSDRQPGFWLVAAIAAVAVFTWATNDPAAAV